MNSGDVLWTWKALCRSACYIPINTRTSSQWKSILHHTQGSLHSSTSTLGASCNSHISSLEFLSCSLLQTWKQHCASHFSQTSQGPILPSIRCGYVVNPCFLSFLSFLLFHLWHDPFSVLRGLCCNLASTCPWSLLSPVTKLLVFISYQLMLLCVPQNSVSHPPTLPPPSYQRFHSHSWTFLYYTTILSQK